MDAFRRWVAQHLTFAAARIHRPSAFKRTHLSFEFVDGVGIVTNEDGHGCPLWYYGDDDYARAWERWPGWGERL